MRKKIAAALIVSALSALVLAGCSQGATDEKAPEEGAEVGTEAVDPAEGETAEPAEGQQVEEAVEPAASAGSSKPAASGNLGSSASKPSSNGSSGSSNGASSSKPAETAKPQAPSHEHSWTHHPAVYVENPVMEKRVVCSCGQLFASQEAWDVHGSSLGFGEGHSYSYKSVQVGTQKELAEPEYWSCSCGATK